MDSSTVRLLLVTDTECYHEALMVGDFNLPAELAHSVETLTLLSFELQEVGILGCTSEKAYNEMLGVGFRVIGSGYTSAIDPNAIIKLVADFCPTHLVLQVPDKAILSWAIRNKIQVVGLFTNHTINAQLAQSRDINRIASLLNHPLVSWVGSQGLKSATNLQHAGVAPEKLIPWGWPHVMETPVQPSKHLDITETPLQLLYIGPVISTKGVGDLLIAMTQLRSRGLRSALKLVGTGEIERFRAQVEQLHLSAHVEFIETIPKQGFCDLFAASDLLVIPSRHEYPEVNLNLIDDALAACIPIVASDHPAFLGRLHHGVNAMVFPAGNARALAHRLERLTSQPRLYEQLSAATQLSQDDMKSLVPWSDVIEYWFEADDRRDQWLAENCLLSARYWSSPSSSFYTQRSA